MAVRVVIKNGERTLEISDPDAYDRYLTAVTTRLGNHIYRNGQLIPKDRVPGSSTKEEPASSGKKRE